MTDKEFVSLCKQSVTDYFNTHSDKTDKIYLNANDVYVVWQCRTGRHWFQRTFRTKCIMKLPTTATAMRHILTVTRNGIISP